MNRPISKEKSVSQMPCEQSQFISRKTNLHTAGQDQWLCEEQQSFRATFAALRFLRKVLVAHVATILGASFLAILLPFCNLYAAIPVGSFNNRTYRLGSFLVSSRLKSLYEIAAGLCRNKRDKCIFTATYISSLFSTINVTSNFWQRFCFYFAQKGHGKGKFPSAPPPCSFPDSKG